MTYKNKKELIELAMKEAHPKCSDKWILTDDNLKEICMVFEEYGVNLDSYHITNGVISKGDPIKRYNGHLIDACGDMWRVDENTGYVFHRGFTIEPTQQSVEYYRDKAVAVARAQQLGAVGDNWEQIVKNCRPWLDPYCFDHYGEL